MHASDSAPIMSLEIKERLLPFGFTPTDDQICKIQEYVRLLLRWNRTVSLTTVTSPSEVVARHFGESMYASRILPVENCRLVDIGTGAGFPGLALKIARPELKIDLIESNKKKCAFLGEVTRSLELADVTIHAQRYEEIRLGEMVVEVATARAVGGFKDLLRWSASTLSPQGYLVLWVGADDANQIMQTTNWVWQPPRRLPDSQRRFLLVGRPIRISEK
jgi:16S rRNA (guanine527-N7)-methyltransferase